MRKATDQRDAQTISLLCTSLLLFHGGDVTCTTPILLCTTKYLCSTTKYDCSTTLYYKVLLCTTKYYSSTTLCYEVLLQYYSVLTAMQLEEPGAATSQGEVFFTVDLGCPGFEYLVTSFTTSFIPRSRPRSLPLQKA